MTALRRRLIAVFAILGLGVFAFPGGLKGWLDDHNRSGYLAAPLAAMRAVDAASAALGVKPIGQSLRARFRALVGDEEG